jgi:hypothetical protein
MMLVDCMFHVLFSRISTEHCLAFVNGDCMPSADEVSSLASTLLRVESKTKT